MSTCTSVHSAQRIHPSSMAMIISTDNVYQGKDIVGIYATTIAAGLTIILCILTALLAFINSFQVRISWFYGPPMLYNCTLLTGMFCSSLGPCVHKINDCSS